MTDLPPITTEEQAKKFCSDLGEVGAPERLELFITKLLEENQRQNLISRKSEDTVWQRHVADSAQLLLFVSRETPKQWLDLGTGAGFPGLVIAAMRPDLKVTLVDSRTRRIEFLENMVNALDLTNCRVEGKRLEVVEPFPADVISARAFAPLPKLLSLSAPFSTARTTYLLPKGRSAAQECEELPARKRKLFHVEQSLTYPDAGIIVGSTT